MEKAQYPISHNAQHKIIKPIGIYTSKIKKDVCPVRWKRHPTVFTSNSFLFYWSKRELLIKSSTFGTTTYLDLFKFYSYWGTSKNTNIAQNRTPSYKFWEWIWFNSIVQEVIWAPAKTNANIPVFLIYWTYGCVVNSLTLSDSVESPSIVIFYISLNSGPLIKNHVNSALFSYTMDLKGD